MRRPTTIRRSAATATPAASRAASSRRSRPTSRMRPTPARGSSSDCVADRVLVADGRATGVAARARAANGELVDLRVEAPVVVVAAGGIESPAVLLRSQHRRPGGGTFLRAAPDLLRRRRLRRGGETPGTGSSRRSRASTSRMPSRATGFLVESVNVSLPFWAGALPFGDGERAQAADAAPAQRRLLARRHARPRLGRGRARRADGEPVVRWELDDPVDQQLAAARCTSSSRACTTRAAPRRS